MWSSASKRATAPRTTSSSGSTRRSSRPSTARTHRARFGLDDIVDFIEEVADFRPLPHRGPDGAGPADGAGAARGHARAQRGAAAARSLRDIDHYVVEVGRLENDGNRILREAVVSLFDHGIDPMMVIRWKDIYERLEDAMTRPRDCEHHGRDLIKNR